MGDGMISERNESVVKKVLEAAFIKEGKRFIRVSELTKLLSKEDKKKFSIKSKCSTNEIIKLLSLDKLSAPYAIVRKGNSKFLFNIDQKKIFQSEAESLKKFIITAIKNKKHITFNAFFTSIPLDKAGVKDFINNMVDEGIIKIKISKSDKPELYPAMEMHAFIAENPKDSDSSDGGKKKQKNKPANIYKSDFKKDLATFKNAYDKLGKGKLLVYIHEIRRFLGWKREDFDGFLDRLMVEGYVKADRGEDSLLTSDQLMNSFADELGNTYTLITWRRPL